MRRLLLVGALLAGCGDDDGPSGPRIDAAPAIDADPACAAANSYGGFPTCTLCDMAGAGCDTIDVNGQVSNVCDCTAQCPCGLRCGDIEIAPGVTVGNVCIR
jgi:hypothetical protein